MDDNKKKNNTDANNNAKKSDRSGFPDEFNIDSGKSSKSK
jgi:hypothetical protein